MPTVEEAATVSQTQMSGAQAAGLGIISEAVELVFTLYYRVVLPLDGFVFWVRADLLRPAALLDLAAYNRVPLNQIASVEVAAETLVVEPASLHHTTLNQQNEAESFSLQKFTLTCKQSVDNLAAVAPGQLWVADWCGLKLAFSSRTGYYRTADTYHYTGDALYPALAGQLIDDTAQLDLTSVVTSNSLPIWLALGAPFPVYPSFLVPDNIVPPYGAVHIGDDDTDPLQAAPFYDGDTGSRWQLCRDRVRLTTYGVRNDAIMDWLDRVQQYTLDNPSTMGLMNSPVPRDAKRGQTELSIIAQKKITTLEVSYYQARIRDVAIKRIVQVFYNLGVDGLPLVEVGPLPGGDIAGGALIFSSPLNSGWSAATAGV